MAAIGGYIGYVIRMPAGVIIGSMLTVALLKYFDLITFGPLLSITFIVQVSLGILLGMSVKEISKKERKNIFIGILLFGIGSIIIALSIGLIIIRFSELDLLTAVLSSATGGMPEMSAFALALSLEAPIVALFHLLRVITVIATYSYILSWAANKEEHNYDSVG
jgi:membrane AbrB-like protein